MRKVIISLFAVVACASFACGQGQVTFINSSTTRISTNAIHGGPATGPTEPYAGGGEPQFFYALFAAPSTVTSVSGVMDANWTFTGAYATNTTAGTGGRLFGSVVTLPAPYAFGTTFSFLIRGWSSSIAGQDWATVQGFTYRFEVDPNATGSLGQFFGTSSIATIVVGGPLLPASVIFGTIPGVTIQGFVLDQVPIPEPSVFALVGLGSAALMVFHRWLRNRKPSDDSPRNNL